ncbi:MAG TPA: acyl-CoA dehydrogenase family protein [Nocardioides sp.]|uniref:acyl-CoA dehydrogenase family protein n=1 Tax=Nocardioides sp. TaxID=35761 RepID=UPI002CF86976|nr:acyl-CoA dehydrogenase family protein [Nocardioides sp.]HQR26248.1 acyl-CoA dehydrogenase family protein [Nocardioides sp.]
MYGLSDADRAIQATARAFADDLIPHEEHAEAHGGEPPEGVAAAFRRRALEQGLFATNMPVSVGGRGCTSLQQVLVQEQAGRVTNALAWVLATPPAWWPEVASEPALERWLRPTVRGELTECYAITEERAGSDVSELATTARREGDEYVLNGTKWHVTSYNEADYAFVQAVLTDGPHAGEHVLVVVDIPTPGMEVVRTPAYSHTFAHHHPVVRLTDVRVPVGHLVGGEGDGMRFAHEWFRFERLMVAARCLGAADRLVEETGRFAQERVVGGRPLAERQLVQAMLADSVTELFAARSMVYEVARSVDAGADRTVLHARCSMAKLYASEMAGRVADRCVQVFGGRGYMRENVAERFYRELRVERIWEGASELQRVIVAEQLAKRGLRALV